MKRIALAAPVFLLLTLLWVLHPLPLFAVDSGEAQWIWYPEDDLTNIPAASRYFRKTFELQNPESGQIEITCDNSYELYVNGRKVGVGNNWQELDYYDVSSYLLSGRNVIAIRGYNDSAGSSAGLMARVTVKRRGNTAVSRSTDGGWRTTAQAEPGWNTRNFRDSGWKYASELGEFGKTLPWRGRVSANGKGAVSRFSVRRGFRVQRVIRASETGSLVAMTFNERGDIIASQERGPLLLITDTDGDHIVDRVLPYAKQMRNCQGILCLNGFVYAVGNGPEGTGFYRCADQDADGQADKVEMLFKFKRGMSEHGPHAVQLGPEGLIYIAIGNHSGAEVKFEAASPYHHYYEGDLVPRQEDPSGHANGIQMPAGTVIRTDANGSFCELVAGGIRNSFDLAFNAQGELFTFDSDMEWDEGLPWYRPTRVLHVVAGGEYGWRSGWAKYPEYYIDHLPPALELGRGSPTGLTFYNHYRYPEKYRDAMFACDWSQGRIYSVLFKRRGGTYSATSELFIEGRPLNVTDIAVAPDGWLYFSTGGRGTEGGVYRIVYEGDVKSPREETGIMKAIRMPQIQAAWSRDEVARFKESMGNDWDQDIYNLAMDRKRPAEDRCRALELMQLVGPFPSKSQLIKLTHEDDPLVRAKATYLLGIHVDSRANGRLIDLIDDADPTVRRQALESLARGRQVAPLALLVKRLADSHQFVRWAAMRAIQQMPLERWEDRVLKAQDVRVFTMGCVALLALDPNKQTCEKVVERYRELAKGHVSDDDFVDMLRVLELALAKGDFSEQKLRQLGEELAVEFPARDHRMNREVVRLLSYLGETGALDRFFKHLASPQVADVEKAHLAIHMKFLANKFSVDQKLKLLSFYEEMRSKPGGNSLSRYVDNVARDVIKTLNEEERQWILANGAKLPGVSLQILKEHPKELTDRQVEELIELDEKISELDDKSSSDLATGIAAVLGRSQHPQALEYLRKNFEMRPERRQDVAMVLSTLPTDDRAQNIKNWPLMVRALPTLEGVAAQMVLQTLANIPFRPKRAEPIRQVILSGLRLKEEGAADAVAVLELWTGQKLSAADEKWDTALAAWQDWFSREYPSSPPAELPTAPQNARWTFQELLDYLETPQGRDGDRVQGALIFATKGQCIKCHRFRNLGESIGPDLTTVSRRFQRKEVLESMLFPSQVISDQYASKTIITTDGRTIVGIVGATSNGGKVVLQSNGEKIYLRERDIDEIASHPKSAMPEGLLDNLSLQEIADLFAYLFSDESDR